MWPVPCWSRGIGRYVAVAVLAAGWSLAATPTAVAASPAQPGVPPGAIGLRILDVPVLAKDDPRARLYIVDSVKPGSVIHRRVQVTNTTPTTARVTLYAAAASIQQAQFLGAAGHTANDLSSWITVGPGVAQVPSAGGLTADVAITVPADAAPGEQYAVVWAEVRSPAASTGVIQVNRVGIRVYLQVGGAGLQAASFGIQSLTAGRTAQGRPELVAAVLNDGGRALDMSGTLTLSGGPAGLSAGPFPAQLGSTLAPGLSEKVLVLLGPQVPDGPWLARITLRSGLVVRTSTATITFPSQPATQSVPVATAHRHRLSPALIWTVIIVSASAVCVGGLALRRRA